MGLHINYCKSFGIPVSEIVSTPEHQACTAYTRYMLDIGQSQDRLALHLAMAACLLGYGALARKLYDDPNTVTGEENRYWPWIENYVADDYLEAVRVGRELIERGAVGQSPKRVEELVNIFKHATRMEIGFWEMFPSS
jgi:thiaminase